jgi:outer membrane protein OmpA-like peptidoglycan-associated protein/Tol biopolymer transport system component
MKGLIIVLLLSTFTALQAQVRLPKNISRVGSIEYSPSISADGKTMIFQTDLYQRRGWFNIWMTFKNPDGWWNHPKQLKSINKTGAKTDVIGGPVISYDGNTVFFFANYTGRKGAEDIYYAIREGNEFGGPINIGPAINTAGFEGFPSISPDGSTLYFTRQNGEPSINGKACYSIWASDRDSEGKWQKAYKLPAPINTGCEKHPKIMTDNEMLVFASIRESSLGGDNYDLFYTRKNETGDWGPVTPLSNVNTFDDNIFAAMSACGDEMYLIALTKEKGYENNYHEFDNLDIYKATVNENDKPKSAAIINGRMIDAISGKPLAGEIAIIKNGNEDNTGVISSNKQGGLFTLILTKGNVYTVIYKADGHAPKEVLYDMTTLSGCETRTENIKIDKWSGSYTIHVINRRTGKPIAVKATLTDQKSRARAKSDFEGLDLGIYKSKITTGGQYSISLSGANISDTTYNYRPVVKDFSREGFIDTVLVNPGPPRLNIKIVNKETGKEVPNAILLLVEANSRKTMHRAVLEGDSTFDIKYDETYVMLGVAANHFRTREILEVSKSDERELIEMEIELVELKPGAKLVVNNITFASNSSELRKSSFEEIDQVIAVLSQNNHIKIEIAAHTDDIGENEPNIILSNARAKTVLDYMISKGIASNRLISKGYGETEPAVPNNSVANRALNRRVEFRIPKN